MSVLDVACAIIEHKRFVLCVQRSSRMPQPLRWEFPGGKLEIGESAEGCIIREIKEELGIKIRVRTKLPEQVHQNIRLIPFICSWEAGDLQLYEHKDARWLLASELYQLDWCPADIPVIKEYLNFLKKSQYGK